MDPAAYPITVLPIAGEADVSYNLPMTWEITIILLLVLLNGAFAMAEMAIVTARKSRLQVKAEKGSRSAQYALKLAEDPSQFLSTVQIGITLIGIIAGVYGGVTIAADLEMLIRGFVPALSAWAYVISYSAVVVTITFLSLIIGELLPKQLALAFPEAISTAMAPMLRLTLLVFKPFVLALDCSTKAVLRILPLQIPEEHSVTDEDVRSLIKEGTKQGTIETEESSIASRALRLGERTVQSIMTPRIDLVKIYIDKDPMEIWNRVIASPHSYFPAFISSTDEFVGILPMKELAVWHDGGHVRPIREILKEPAALPASLSILESLRTFRKEKRHIAIVVDEHGTIDGLITTHDLLEAMVGELSDNPQQQPTIIAREDGSMLVDAWLDIGELADHLTLPHDALIGDGHFRSVGGLLMWKLSGIPREGDAVSISGYRFEVVDMDRRRVDKVLIKKED